MRKKFNSNNILRFILYNIYHENKITTLLDALSLQGASLL